MNARTRDGSAGDVDHGAIGSGCSSFRRPDSRVAQVAARQACSDWSSVDDGAREHFDRGLRRDLESGEWERRYGHLRTRAACEGSLVLVRATP
ncbi:hypothetical protein [Kitasatospora purpeofusca]|uniref:hypothetical protein n=1 Tax=Kitasatospora purpeofusca TaxID=67352 RepID=UPI00382CABD5